MTLEKVPAVHPASPVADQVSAAQALIERVAPAVKGKFVVGPLLDNDAKGSDRFTLRDLPDGRIELRGTSGVGVASAFNWYLKNRAHCLITWSGDQLKLPNPLPPVGTSVEKTSPYKWRFFYNYCTLSYTGAWWDWTRWQREIDFLALQGINMPLAPVGLEGVWYHTLLRMGWTDKEARDFLVGPAFFAWQWMTNIEGHMGPLPKSWIDSHIILGQQILRRERELGMTPVQQGFTGWVPRLTRQKFPTAKIALQNGWLDFPPTAQMDPLDPLFPRFGRTFLEEETRLFGTSHFYGGDPFHEGQPPSNSDEYLGNVGKTIWKLLSDFDLQATWVMQAWSIRQPIATQPPVDHLLVVDLAGGAGIKDGQPAYWGRPFISGTLHNFGGRINLHGDLNYEISNQRAKKAATNPNCVGAGFFMEGTEQNPAYYSAAFEMLWDSEGGDLNTWLANYARDRYGADSPNAVAAWKLLAAGPYGPGTSALEWSSMPAARPALDPKKSGPNSGFKIPYDPLKLVDAEELLLKDSDKLSDSAGYRFDVMDVGRQVLSNLAQELQTDVRVAYLNKDAAALDKATERFESLLADLDRLLNTRNEYSLGYRIEAARRWGTTPAEADLYERNERTLVTLWGAVPGGTLPLNAETPVKSPKIFDYSWREWGGLVGTFYLPRWKMFDAELKRTLAAGERWPDESKLPQAFGRPTFRATPFLSKMADWETQWTMQIGGVASQPQGDTIAIAKQLMAKWAPVARSMNSPERLAAIRRLSESDFGKDVGGWKPEQVSSTWKPLKLDVTNAMSGEGNYVVTFRFREGNQALRMRNVQLLANGQVIASDAHEGWAGNDHRQNAFTLKLPNHAFGTTYEIAFEARTDNAGRSSGAVFINKP